ncbi:hypothetical protein MMH89_04705 [Candidatus Comchoanobacter bicostacola]|uniref:Uncharacterized protein n=1 Tax=Candidatus Comchoanobacter bicostacola TaxID=2919598 RepID=A0ABY5DKJ9_9GAMM|nr:hypothetical protein [Candidatus Comchoanobacter bicostacola]UTC24518.1 hypothetical protein MMH89_04705 [Candidatus Comchoanobacter bicostacola]
MPYSNFADGLLSPGHRNTQQEWIEKTASSLKAIAAEITGHPLALLDSNTPWLEFLSQTSAASDPFAHYEKAEKHSSRDKNIYASVPTGEEKKLRLAMKSELTTGLAAYLKAFETDPSVCSPPALVLYFDFIAQGVSIESAALELLPLAQQEKLNGLKIAHTKMTHSGLSRLPGRQHASFVLAHLGKLDAMEICALFTHMVTAKQSSFIAAAKRHKNLISEGIQTLAGHQGHELIIKEIMYDALNASLIAVIHKECTDRIQKHDISSIKDLLPSGVFKKVESLLRKKSLDAPKTQIQLRELIQENLLEVIECSGTFSLLNSTPEEALTSHIDIQPVVEYVSAVIKDNLKIGNPIHLKELELDTYVLDEETCRIDTEKLNVDISSTLFELFESQKKWHNKRLTHSKALAINPYQWAQTLNCISAIAQFPEFPFIQTPQSTLIEEGKDNIIQLDPSFIRDPKLRARITDYIRATEHTISGNGINNAQLLFVGSECIISGERASLRLPRARKHLGVLRAAAVDYFFKTTAPLQHTTQSRKIDKLTSLIDTLVSAQSGISDKGHQSWVRDLFFTPYHRSTALWKNRAAYAHIDQMYGQVSRFFEDNKFNESEQRATIASLAYLHPEAITWGLTKSKDPVLKQLHGVIEPFLRCSYADMVPSWSTQVESAYDLVPAESRGSIGSCLTAIHRKSNITSNDFYLWQTSKEHIGKKVSELKSGDCILINKKLLELTRDPIIKGKVILTGINKITNKKMTQCIDKETTLKDEPCPGLIHWTLPTREIASNYCQHLAEHLDASSLNPCFHLLATSVLDPLKAYLFNKINTFRNADQCSIRSTFTKTLDAMWNHSTFAYTEKTGIIDAYRESPRSLNHTLSEALEAQRLYSGEITVRAATPPPRSTQTKVTPGSCSQYLSDVRADIGHTRRTLNF